MAKSRKPKVRKSMAAYLKKMNKAPSAAKMRVMKSAGAARSARIQARSTSASAAAKKGWLKRKRAR